MESQKALKWLTILEDEFKEKVKMLKIDVETNPGYENDLGDIMIPFIRLY